LVYFPDPLISSQKVNLGGSNWHEGLKLQHKVNLGGLKRVVFLGAKITTLENLRGQKCN